MAEDLFEDTAAHLYRKAEGVPVDLWTLLIQLLTAKSGGFVSSLAVDGCLDTLLTSSPLVS